MTAVQNKDKTHCKRGHEFTPENTYITTRKCGGIKRTCIECRRMMARDRYHKKQAKLREELEQFQRELHRESE